MKKNYFEKYILPIQEERIAQVVSLRSRFEELRHEAVLPGADLATIANKLEKIRGSIRKTNSRIQLEFEIPSAQRTDRWEPYSNYRDSRGIGIIQPGKRRKRSLY